MARRGCVITKAVVEQELRFDSEFYFNEFIHKLDYYEEPYKIVSKTYHQGSLFVVIRKRYGEYPFLGDTDPSSLATFQKEMRDELRGVKCDADGSLIICDAEKYWEWESNAARKSRY